MSLTVDSSDVEAFLNRKHYSLAFRAQIADIEDFLEMSEYNLEWMGRRERRSIQAQDLSGCPPELRDQYRAHLLQNAEHRFSASLPMRLRYGALIALITAVEWETGFLSERADFHIARSPKGCNEAVHQLRGINEVVGLGASDIIDNYEALVCVRNAIVHSAGVEHDYKYRDDLRRHISRLNGFSIATWHAWLGSCITIERDALVPYIQAMADLLPFAWKEADTKGMLKLRDT